MIIYDLLKFFLGKSWEEVVSKAKILKGKYSAQM